jgi:predicted ferric reductase
MSIGSIKAGGARIARPWSGGKPIGRITVTTIQGVLMSTVLFVNAAVIVYLWLNGGGVSSIHSWATLFTSIGRITGLFAMYSLLLQLLLLARLPILEKVIGFDRRTVLHRINGKACVYLIAAHIGFITAGYAMTDRISIWAEFTAFLRSYPDMIQATIGSGLIIAVAVSSLVIVRRKMRYQAWYFVHLMSYAGVYLAWTHQTTSGNEFITNPTATAYWTALYVETLQLVLLFRVLQPILRSLWHRMRVAEVVEEGPGVVSIRVIGRHLDWIDAAPGQFFLWRFLDRSRWHESHPFSLSAAPDGSSLRITVKALGDYSSEIGSLRPGTRVVVEGPFGSFTEEARRRERVLLVAGGVGITPIRAMLETMTGDITVMYRAASESDVIFRDELDRLACERGIELHYVLGDHRAPGAGYLLSTPHLRELVPDIDRREVFLCGPPPMMRILERNVRRAGVAQASIHTDKFAF